MGSNTSSPVALFFCIAVVIVEWSCNWVNYHSPLYTKKSRHYLITCSLKASCFTYTCFQWLICIWEVWASWLTSCAVSIRRTIPSGWTINFYLTSNGGIIFWLSSIESTFGYIWACLQQWIFRCCLMLLIRWALVLTSRATGLPPTGMILRCVSPQLLTELISFL